jgi:hypothetical protein
MKETNLAFEELRLHMLDVIASARDATTDSDVVQEATPKPGKSQYAQEGPSNRRLTNDDLLSDVIVRLLFSSSAELVDTWCDNEAEGYVEGEGVRARDDSRSSAVCLS